MRSNTNKFFLVIIGAIGLVGLVLKLIMPTHNPVIHNTLIDTQNANLLNFGRVRYLGKELALPENLEIIRVEQQVVTSLAGELAQSLNLNPLEGEENYWVNDQWSLVYDDQNHLFLLTNDLVPKQTGKIDQDQAFSQAQGWFERLGLSSNLVANKNSIEYFEGEYQLKPSSANLADYIQIQFNYQINSYPLFVGTNSQSPYIMMLDSGGNLVKLVVYPQQVIKTQVESSKPTISVDRALDNIKHKKLASIIRIDGGLTNQKTIAYEEVVFNQVLIEYRLETDGQTAIPYYRFSGVATDSNQKSTKLELITPAIDI